MAPVTAKSSASNSKDENNQQGSGGGSRKPASSRSQEQALKCPRCDSQNTKFCYYNNYSLTQPRHFCKTCRRYWTKGGALRNVPIGGGCRKSKKSTSSSSCKLTPSRFLTGDPKDPNSPDIGGLKFFHGLTPAMDFQLGGLNSTFSRAVISNHSTSPIYNQLTSSFGDISLSASANSGAISASSPSCFNLETPSAGNSLMGFTFPFSSVSKTSGDQNTPFGFMSGTNAGDHHVHNSLASIESLSSINQEIHWKLQQQRLAMLYGNNSPTIDQVNNTSVNPSAVSYEKPQPILFQNLENSTTPRTIDNNSRKGSSSTEWFFDNTTTSNDHHQNHEEVNHNWNNAMNQAGWSNMSQYSTI